MKKCFKLLVACLALVACSAAPAQEVSAPVAGTQERVKMTIYRPIASDKTLRGTLARWARMADLKFEWYAPDYPLTQRALDLPPASTLNEAIPGLAQVYAKIAKPLSVSIAKGTLVVTEPGGPTAEPAGEPKPAVTAASDTQAGAAPAGAQESHWKIARGQAISQAMRNWCTATHDYVLLWDAPELVSQVDVDLTGSFENAVSIVIEALNRASEMSAGQGKGGSQGVPSSTVRLKAKLFRANNPKILSVMEN